MLASNSVMLDQEKVSMHGVCILTSQWNGSYKPTPTFWALDIRESVLHVYCYTTTAHSNVVVLTKIQVIMTQRTVSGSTCHKTKYLSFKSHKILSRKSSAQDFFIISLVKLIFVSIIIFVPGAWLSSISVFVLKIISVSVILDGNQYFKF